MNESPCPACGSGPLTPAFRGDRVPFLRCRACGSLADPRPLDAGALEHIYQGPEYFTKGAGASGEMLWGYPGDYLSDQPNIEAKFTRVLGHLERYVEGGILLDVGCGPGFLMTVARERGWSPVGLDLNPWAVEYARHELGLDARVAMAVDSGFGDAQLDAVTAMDLIEHVPDADDLVSEIARVVRPGGALAILTPDAGSAVSRSLGGRWPEVRRPGEHAVLFSVDGLSSLLARHGFAAYSWHYIGKTTSVANLVADVSPVAPRAMGRLGSLLKGSRFGERVVEFDPRTKFCLYARRLHDPQRPPGHRPARVPKDPERLAHAEVAILEELESLGEARRLADWMFDQFAADVGGAVAEIGAGIGTFSERILARGAERLLLMEPDRACSSVLRRRFGGDEHVRIVEDGLPGCDALAPDEFELVVCQNVLEHIGDDGSALAEMAASLRPGGHLALVVPHRPELYGPLDDAYAHWRRYRSRELFDLIEGVGLRIESMRTMNLLGVPGWRWKNRRPAARIGRASLRLYEALLAAWRPVEDAVRPRGGLSLSCLAVKPRQPA